MGGSEVVREGTLGDGVGKEFQNLKKCPAAFDEATGGMSAGRT